MQMLIDTTLPAEIVIGAAGLTEIAQNVRTILTTPKGSVPLDRDFGVRLDLLDRPLPEAMAEFRGQAIAEVQRLESRVRVVSVDFKPDPDGAVDGRLFPVVRIAVNENA